MSTLLGKARRLDAGLALRVSAAGLAFVLSVGLSTMLPGAPYFPDLIVFPLTAGAILIHFRTVALLTVRPRGWRWLGGLISPLPRHAGLAFAAAFLLGWVAIIALMTGGQGGQPTELHGHFYLNNHGSMVLVSHSEFVREQLRWQRVFSLGAALFFGLAVMVNWVALRTPETFSSQLDQPG